jgi:hypothetical protein
MYLVMYLGSSQTGLNKGCRVLQVGWVRVGS